MLLQYKRYFVPENDTKSLKLHNIIHFDIKP